MSQLTRLRSPPTALPDHVSPSPSPTAHGSTLRSPKQPLCNLGDAHTLDALISKTTRRDRFPRAAPVPRIGAWLFGPRLTRLRLGSRPPPDGVQQRLHILILPSKVLDLFSDHAAVCGHARGTAISDTKELRAPFSTQPRNQPPTERKCKAPAHGSLQTSPTTRPTNGNSTTQSPDATTTGSAPPCESAKTHVTSHKAGVPPRSARPDAINLDLAQRTFVTPS